MNKPVCKSLSVEDVGADTPKLWLEKYAKDYDLKYLLAHADDGVIWGEFRSEKSQPITARDDEKFQLITSGDLFSQFAKLRSHTLQQCRIFGKNAEVMLWKAGQTWKARLIKDDNNPERLEADEYQILWGTQKEEEKSGFTLVSDGSQGLKHAVPLINIPFSQDKKLLHRPIRLQVRHYIDDDESGVARIYLSRLVHLFYDN